MMLLVGTPRAKVQRCLLAEVCPTRAMGSQGYEA